MFAMCPSKMKACLRSFLLAFVVFSLALVGDSAAQTNLDIITSDNPSNMSGVLGLGLRIVGGSVWTFGGQNSFGFRVYAVLLSNIKGLAGGFVLCIVCGFCLPFASQEKLNFACSLSNMIGFEGFRTFVLSLALLGLFFETK